MAIKDSILSALLDYHTPKVVHIKSKTIGSINKIIQIGIIGYIIIWVLIIRKGYQEVNRGLSGVTTELTGISYTKNTSLLKVWDVPDVMVPGEENKAFFVTTNVIVTNNQTQSVCVEDSSVKAARCQSDSDCPAFGHSFLHGNGVSNGTCDTEAKMCYVRAWCPIVDDDTVEDNSSQVLEGVENFTFLIKNHIYFPEVKVSRSNVGGNRSYVNSCRYHPITDQLCPVFRIGDVIDEALSKMSPVLTFDDIRERGSVISLRIKWDCNLDYSVTECTPHYTFDRLDGEGANGYNYYYTHNYVDGGVAHRQLIKAYGILFIVLVNAQGGKFDLIATIYNIASGIVILGVAQVVCDFIILYIMRQKEFFKLHKYATVIEEEDMDCVESNRLMEERGRNIDYGTVDVDQSAII